MFKIAQYCAAEIALAKQVTALEEMKNDPELKRELAFDAELEALLAKHSMNKERLHTFLNAQQAAIKAAERRKGGPVPVAAFSATASSSSTTSRSGSKNSPRGNVKLYTNPHTGEQVYSARRDHSTLKQWAAEHGLQAVISWAV